MSLRLLYLARYTSTDKSNKPKKSKSKVRPSKASVVVSGTAFSEKAIADVVVAENEIIPELEDAPITVAQKEFKGFKRIDNGQLAVQRDVQEDVELKLQPPQTTVYRDSTGRIIDINQKRQQHAETQDAKVNADAHSRISLTESQQMAQANDTRQKRQELQVDDPLLVFNPDAIHKEIELYQTYTKGLQPANRFGIKAGYFWDGTDRSNGFEELLSRKRNEAKFTKKDRAITEVYDLNDESE